ncbi:MAG: hypothetical protein QOK48_3542, partial [Blastocatellia bacterium]|nr:hypothetical protein [Blastocatellia bacterium]
MKRLVYEKEVYDPARMHLRTAKRLSPTAQGWRAATTRGAMETKGANPNGVADANSKPGNRNPFRVADSNLTVTQGSRKPATLGFVAQPLRGCKALVIILALAICAFAQNPASITGRVTDQQGA